MTTQEAKQQVVEIYNAKGLVSVYSFLKKQGIPFRKNVVEFGLHTNKAANEEKNSWINKNELRFHYFSVIIKARSGYGYNLIRGIEIVF